LRKEPELFVVKCCGEIPPRNAPIKTDLMLDIVEQAYVNSKSFTQCLPKDITVKAQMEAIRFIYRLVWHHSYETKISHLYLLASPEVPAYKASVLSSFLILHSSHFKCPRLLSGRALETRTPILKTRTSLLLRTFKPC